MGVAKLLFIELPPVVSVTAIIQRDKKILCVDLSYYKGLGLPGGIINGDEEPIGALKREVFEETGLAVTATNFLGTASAPFRKISCLTLVYAVEAAGDLRDSSEGTLIWLDPKDALPRLTYPNARLAIERFVNNSES